MDMNNAVLNYSLLPLLLEMDSAKPVRQVVLGKSNMKTAGSR